MSSFELFVVFAALIALIGLAAIAIDWVGRPLKTKRFIPRIYRFDDEIYHEEPMAGLAQGDPAAHYGQAGLPPVAPPPVGYGPGPYPVPAHPPVAAQPHLQPLEAPPASSAPAAPSVPATPVPAADVPQPSKPARPTVVATVHDTNPDINETGEPKRSTVSAKTTTSSSVFSDEISDDADDNPEQSRIATTEPVAAPTSWKPGDRLDARQNDRKPTTAIKAQRFWQTIAAALEPNSHFDDDSRSRMADGRAPRRRNPRTGANETAALVGLRAAASADEVRMYWPDDSVDPWSSS